MWILLSVSANDPDAHHNCDYALIKVTPAFLDLVRQRHRAFRAATPESPHLYCLMYWWDAPVFIGELLFETAPQVLENLDAYRFLPTLPFDPYAQGNRMETVFGYVSDTDIWWTATPKYRSVTLTTTRIPLSILFDENLQLLSHLKSVSDRTNP